MANRHKGAPKKPRKQGTGKPDPTKDRAAHDAKRGVKMSGATLSQLSRPIEISEEFHAALAAMDNESDRGVAIMGAALIEEGLLEGLQAMLVNKDDMNALFYDQGAPFGTLRAKTVAAYALGLCSKPIADQIDVIRSIRNQFSHSLRAIDFQHEEIKAACRKLSLWIMSMMKLPAGKTSPDARVTYRLACQLIYIGVNRSTEAFKNSAAGRAKELLNAFNNVSASLQSDFDKALGKVAPD